jgi:hypothetical protein
MKSPTPTLAVLPQVAVKMVKMENRHRPTHNPTRAADHHHPNQKLAIFPILMQSPMKIPCMVVQNLILSTTLLDAQDDLWARSSSSGRRSER